MHTPKHSIEKSRLNRHPISLLALTSVWLTICHPGGLAQTFEAEKDFDAVPPNQNGAWTYGWMSAGFGAFHEFTEYGIGSDGTTPVMGTSGGNPQIWKNEGVNMIFGIPPSALSLHPGPGGEASVVRWAAPQRGIARVTGEFFPGDAGTMGVAVRLRGSTWWEGVDSGAFSLQTKVDAGDPIDFAVFGGYHFGNTGLKAIVSFSPTADANWIAQSTEGVVGELDGLSAVFSPNEASAILDDSSTYFDTAWFSPPIPFSDVLTPTVHSTNRTFRFNFDGPVRNPILHIGSLASTLTFGTTNITKLSGDETFIVEGSTVSGQYSVPNPAPYWDSNGSIRLNGIFCSISFTGITSVHDGYDGLWLQIDGSAAAGPEIAARQADSSGIIELSYFAGAGISYQLEYATSLSTPDWTSLSDVAVGNNSQVVTTENTAGNNSRFYRVRFIGCN